MGTKSVKMSKIRRTAIGLFLLVLAANLLVSCNNNDDSGQSGSVITELANVESVTLIAIGKTPIKIHASVRGEYPNDCTLIYDIQQNWVKDVYEIRIKTKRPIHDEECTPGPIPFEDLYEIPVNHLEAGEYVVDVNGVQEPLIFAFDNE